MANNRVDEVFRDFHDVVNMSPGELEAWGFDPNPGRSDFVGDRQ